MTKDQDYYICQQTDLFLDKLYSGVVCYHPPLSCDNLALSGLSCDPTNKNALDLLYKIKKRKENKQLIFVCSSQTTAFDYWYNLPRIWQIILQKVWPENLSVIHKLNKTKNNLFTNNIKYQTIAFRVPNINSNNFFYHVLEKFSYPLPTTSINISTKPTLDSYTDVVNFLNEHDIYYSLDLLKINYPKKTQALTNQLTDQKTKNYSSTVIELTSRSYKLLRQGSYELKYIDNLLTNLKVI